MIPTDAKAALSFQGSATVLPTPEEIRPVIQLKLMATGIGTAAPAAGNGKPHAQNGSRRHERPPYLRGAYRRPHPQDPAEVPRLSPAPVPGRHPHPGLAGRPSRRRGAARPPGAAHPHPAHGLPRAGAHPVPARRRRSLRDPPAQLLPPGQRRAPQSRHRQAHHQGHLPRGRRGLPRAGRQEGGAQGRLRAPPLRGPEAAGRPPGAALHLRHQGHGVGRQRLRLPVPAPRHQPRGPGPPRLQGHGDPLLRPRQPRLQPGFRGEHLRQCRRSLPARERRRAWTRSISPASPAA